MISVLSVGMMFTILLWVLVSETTILVLSLSYEGVNAASILPAAAGQNALLNLFPALFLKAHKNAFPLSSTPVFSALYLRHSASERAIFSSILFISVADLKRISPSYL